jgi:cobalt-zinc-cadmium efflux system protein
LYICLAINLIFVAAEAFTGWKSNSTGLLSDAGHNLSDALGLLLSLAAIYLDRSGNKTSQTVSRYITLANGLLLFGAIALIVYESIDKIINPQEINATAVIAVSSVAIIINGLTAWLLMKGQGDEINIKAAYLHAATDALVSVSVVISGIIISTTGWNMIDPLLSLAISIFIAFPTIKLIHTALKTIRNS